MSDVYEELRSITEDVIQEWGTPITLIKKYRDPAWVKNTRRVGVQIQTYWTHSVTGVEVLVDPAVDKKYIGDAVEGSYKSTFMPAITIAAGDRRLYVTKVPKPVEGDIIICKQKRLTVISCNPTEPGAVSIIYDVQAR